MTNEKSSDILCLSINIKNLSISEGIFISEEEERMKDERIARINSIGKAGHIIAIICKIAVSIGIVGLIVGLVFALALPKNLVKLEVSGAAKVNLDLEAFDVSFAV